MPGGHFEQARIHTHHAAGDGGETANHHAVQFTTSHTGQVGLDEQRGLGLAHEDVGRSAEGFTAAGAHGSAHDPGHGADEELQDSVVVKDRGDGADQYDDAGDD